MKWAQVKVDKGDFKRGRKNFPGCAGVARALSLYVRSARLRDPTHAREFETPTVYNWRTRGVPLELVYLIAGMMGIDEGEYWRRVEEPDKPPPKHPAQGELITPKARKITSRVE